MPSPRYIQPQESSNWMGETLKAFIEDRTGKLKEQQESDALQDIYRQHKNDGENLEKTIFDIQSRPGISPTTRVNTVKQLMEFQTNNKELQEKAKKAAENKAVIADLERRKDLTPGSLAAYESNPTLALQVTKEPKGTQASQPINEDQLRRIQHIESQPEFINAPNSEKARMLRNAGVSKENIDSIVNPYIQEEKDSEEKEYKKLRVKSVDDYVDNAKEAGEVAEEMKFAIQESRKALGGDITGPGFKALMKNNPYGQLLVGLTPSESLLQSSNKKLLEGTKGLFGPRPTEKEIFVLLNSMLPSIGKSKEANLAGLEFIEKVNDMKLLRSQLVDKLTDGGTKYVPNLQQQINEQMHPYAETLRDELEVANEKYGSEDTGQKIKVTAPNGETGFMTQEQIDKARESNVIFTPVKS